MTKQHELALKIEELRCLMHDLMSERDELVHPDIVRASQMLDKLLNEYDELLKRTT
jgi:stage 0 sporulation regulatory protein